jgi:hypothetical protein
MTENEAFEHISNLAGDYKCFNERITHQESLILYNLIDEIQQYRAIGKVEEVKYLVDSYNGMIHDFGDDMSALEQYRAIGTVEEIKSEHKELIKLSRRYLKDTNELIKYQEIGTIEEFKQAMNFKKYFMELYGEGLEVANWHKNGDEIVEASATELDTMFKEIRNNTIDEFVKQMKELTYKWIDKGIIAVGCIDEIAEQLKAGGKNE